MALINKHDTDGTKGVLAKGEFGFDDHVAGGDSGRVYIGTGTENIPLARLDEVSIGSASFTDELKALLEMKKVKNVTTDPLNDVLVIAYTDNTTSNLNLNDVITDVYVSGASLNATTNVLTLANANGGASVVVNLSDFVNSAELNTAMATKADASHTHSGYVSTESDPVFMASQARNITAGHIAVLNNTSGTNTGDQTSVSGNAGTATKLATARTINGVSFDGSADITISAVDPIARIASSEKGAANGVATLGSDSKIPTTQLPSYVDDVLEFANLAAFPINGESGKIYVAIDTNKSYRWSGSVYVYITSGSVDSVSGKTGVVTLEKADVGLGNVDNTSDVNKPISTATQSALDTKATSVKPVLMGLIEVKVAMSTNNINMYSGNLFTKTISANTTFTISNPSASGNANSFILELTNAGAYAVTWFSGVKWSGGIAPTLTASGVDILGFYSHDGGVTWRGTVISKDSK